MSCALLIAALSFFIGQSDEFPAALRILPLLGVLVLAVLVTMLYWLWRVRIRHSLRGVIGGMAVSRADCGRSSRQPCRHSGAAQSCLGRSPDLLPDAITELPS